jgi:hypothetical protein
MTMTTMRKFETGDYVYVRGSIMHQTPPFGGFVKDVEGAQNGTLYVNKGSAVVRVSASQCSSSYDDYERWMQE